MNYKDIAKLSISLQAVNLASNNIKFIKKKKNKTKDYIDNSLENIVGTSLIKSQADFLEGM